MRHVDCGLWWRTFVRWLVLLLASLKGVCNTPVGASVPGDADTTFAGMSTPAANLLTLPSYKARLRANVGSRVVVAPPRHATRRHAPCYQVLVDRRSELFPGYRSNTPGPTGEDAEPRGADAVLPLPAGRPLALAHLDDALARRPVCACSRLGSRAISDLVCAIIICITIAFWGAPIHAALRCHLVEEDERVRVRHPGKVGKVGRPDLCRLAAIDEDDVALEVRVFSVPCRHRMQR